MKKFFIKGFFFVLIFFLVSFVLQEALIFGIRTIDVGEYGVMNRVVNGEINAEIIISGSSRTWRGINPKIISEITGKSCYNLSSDGVRLELQLPKFKMYLNKNISPTILIQNIDPTSCIISNKIYEPYKYLPYLDDEDFYNGLAKIDDDLWMHKYFPPTNLVYFNFDFYVKFLKEIYYSYIGRETLVQGYFADNSQWSISDNLLSQKYPNGIKPYISKVYVEYLDELEELCRKKNIYILYMSTPQYKEYFNIVKKGMNIHEFFENRAKKSNIGYIDYSESELFDTKEYFYNYNHLNNSGAEILSKEIGEYIKMNFKAK